jgi:hypothetical protein
VVWLGGIIFFGAVMAPVLFLKIPKDWAGSVVGPTLTILHWIGLACGASFLVIFLFADIKRKHTRFEKAVPGLVLLMLSLTSISQFYLLPKMERMRVIMEADSDFYTPLQISTEDMQKARAARVQFDALHPWSTRIEGTILILGLIVLGYFARAANGDLYHPESPV